MRLLDSLVDTSFRDEKAGRVVVFAGDRRNRGHLVKSAADEQKIRSFLKMYFVAHFSILFLGIPLANAWSTFFVHAFLDRPAAHLPGATAISLGIFSLVVGLPYLILWRSYRKAPLSFVSAEDEILVSRRTVRRSWIAFAAFIALGALFLALAVAVALLVRPK
jgi:hypothetical protein